jgi:hypothetical protein
MRLTAAFFICSLTLTIPTIEAARPNQPSRQAQSQSGHDNKLNKHVPEFRTSGRSLIATLVDLAYEFELPMGIEYIDRESVTRPLELEFRDDPLGDIITALVAHQPEYRVSFVGGVVQIYSPQARDDPSNPLNKPIKDFSVIAVDTRDADLQLACALSRELAPSANCGGSITNGQWGPLKITMHLQNAKVFEVLDAIVQQNGQAIWIVTALPERLSKTQTGGLWHVYPLQVPFRASVLEKLTSAIQ